MMIGMLPNHLHFSFKANLVLSTTHSRLITTECDKTIKIYKEDTEATPETHPVDMRGWTTLCRKRKRY